MIIATERLTIRRIMAEDWESIQKIWIDQKKSVYACYDTLKNTNSDAVKKRIDKWAYFESDTEHMFYAIQLNNVIIGYVAFNQRENGYEIGYCFLSQYQGKGYAKESILALLSAIMRVQPNIVIIARTALDNIPSVNLLQSLNFKLIKTEEVSFYQDNDGKDIYFEGGIFELNINHNNVQSNS